MARPEKIRLGDMLVQQNLVTGEQLKLALEEQKRSGRKLGRVLVESGYVTEEGISTGLARQIGADFVDLKTFKPQPELIKLCRKPRHGANAPWCWTSDPACWWSAWPTRPT
jgi:MSHA biogenesis protein MshE